MAWQCAAIDSLACFTYPAGSSRLAAGASPGSTPLGTYPPSGSCAEVWSVTTSGRNPAASSSGSTSAALPSTPTETARRSRAALSTRSTASARSSARSSRYPVASRRSRCSGSTSTHSATPSFIVTASGCAPPIPPSPAVSTILPARLGQPRAAASAAKVS